MPRILFAIFALLVAIVLTRRLRRHRSAGPRHFGQDLAIANLQVTCWLPQQQAGANSPVIFFSHGFHGSRRQSAFLMQALANAGYSVFAPNHADAGMSRRPPALPFAAAAQWSDTTYADRRDDIKQLLDALQNDPQFAQKSLDWNRVGLAGHSLGGYTALALAGAWPTWLDPRFKAVVALSPYATPFLSQKTLANLRTPVMYQGGTRDAGITPFLRKPGGVYDQSAPPKFYVEFAGAGHLAWTGLRRKFHAIVADYTIAFFNHTLKGMPFPERLTHPTPAVSDLRRQEF